MQVATGSCSNKTHLHCSVSFAHVCICILCEFVFRMLKDFGQTKNCSAHVSETERWKLQTNNDFADK